MSQQTLCAAPARTVSCLQSATKKHSSLTPMKFAPERVLRHSDRHVHGFIATAAAWIPSASKRLCHSVTWPMRRTSTFRLSAESLDVTGCHWQIPTFAFRSLPILDCSSHSNPQRLAHICPHEIKGFQVKLPPQFAAESNALRTAGFSRSTSGDLSYYVVLLRLPE